MIYKLSLLSVATLSLFALSISVFADDAGMRLGNMQRPMMHHIAPGFGPGFGFGHSDVMGSGSNSTGAKLRQALLNGDFATFQALHPTPKNDNANKPQMTKEQFDKMSAQAKKQEAARVALETNNYNAFVTAITPTQTEFAEMVKQHQTQKAIHAAIQAKDYAAFQKATVNTPMANITQTQFTKMIEKKMDKKSDTKKGPQGFHGKKDMHKRG